jgi:preprotein translocase subunit SecB
MADTPATSTDGAPNDQAGGQAPDQANAPRLMVQTQYVKDLSFENPRAPASLDGSQNRPEISVRVDVQTSRVADGRYEVVLQLNVDAKAAQQALFVLELSYGGIFAVANIPDESLQPLLMVECPRLLFPFARRIVADATRDGGLPPLMIDPIDFVAHYRRRLQQAQAEAAAAQTAGGAAAS